MKKINLSKGQVALVDDGDYDDLNQFRWYAQYSKGIDNYYAFRLVSFKKKGKLKNKIILMHRMIMDAPKRKVVDHINHNTLDNRKENLRIVSSRQNNQNKKVKGTSKYPGVCWHKYNKKWRATIYVNGKNKDLGYFKEEREAAKAYERACRELIGEDLVCKMRC